MINDLWDFAQQRQSIPCNGCWTGTEKPGGAARCLRWRGENNVVHEKSVSLMSTKSGKTRNQDDMDSRRDYWEIINAL